MYAYTTSPIRRYADLFAQQAAHNVHGTSGYPKTVTDPGLAAELSWNERRVVACERDCPARWTVHAVARHRMEPWHDGWIVGVRDFGVFVEADDIDELVRRYPGRFQAGQLRRLLRRFRDLRALRGEDREVYFAQAHRLGEQSQSDFTDMRSLGVTITGVSFVHPVYHFVLTCSCSGAVWLWFARYRLAPGEGRSESPGGKLGALGERQGPIVQSQRQRGLRVGRGRGQPATMR